MKKEVILAEIASVLNKSKFMIRTDESMEEILKCSGLKTEYEDNKIFFMKTVEEYYNGRYYTNPNENYNFFRGLNNIFETLYSSSRTEEIIILLSKIGEELKVEWLHNYGEEEDFLNITKLISLYELMDLRIELEETFCTVKAWTGSSSKRIENIFTLETWLCKTYPEIYSTYTSALDAFKDGHAGLCIEACRTTLTGIFSKYKGPDDFAKWQRGLGNISDELPGGRFGIDNKADFKQAIASPSQTDLSEFFKENPNGKFTKTRAIYSIYSMMSDYGTHRQEGTPETPSINDALMMLRMTEAILIWIYKSTTN